MPDKLTCIVCGRVFPKGQGVVFSVGGKEYFFHSKSCAIKFVRRAIEEFEPEKIVQVFDRVRKEFEEELNDKRERTAKKIA